MRCHHRYETSRRPNTFRVRVENRYRVPLARVAASPSAASAACSRISAAKTARHRSTSHLPLHRY